MDNHVQRWETLMSDAQTAYVNAQFEHSLELNNSAISLSKENFNSLFQKNAEKAIATVLVSYFSAIENCQTLANHQKAQQLFNSALHFLHGEKLKSGLTQKQQTAIFRGASQIYKEWCEFINAHSNQVPESRRHDFQTSLRQLSSLKASSLQLH